MAKKIHVFGKVQGVFFRASTQQVAKELGINGWVRNEYDGSVLIHAEGEESQIEKFMEWAHKGPLMAKVEKVEVENLENIPYYDFQVIY